MAEEFGIGYVGEPCHGHEPYATMMSIPYLRLNARDKVTVADIRFRCIENDCAHGKGTGHGKYNSVTGSEPRLFNTAALATPDVVAVCEGELDAITAGVCGVPAVAAPGATTWQDHYAELFDGFESVYILADGDKAGHQFAKTVMSKLRQGNGEVRGMPDGYDVNSFVLAHGASALRERIGV